AAAMSEQAERIVQKLTEIGRAQGKTPAQVAVAWILANEDVTAPIIGPDRPEHVEEVFGALEVELGAEELAVLDALSQWIPLARTH
ncbi:MAG: aldo/keto reductase, partial [Gemmatimonadota bacterium]|nr:aldo/keto reductase [Gemmatimonadota bacterium]